METYYQRNKEEVLRKSRERRLRKMVEEFPEKEIARLRKKVDRLTEKLTVFKELVDKLKGERSELKKELNELKKAQTKPVISEAKREKILSQITTLEHLMLKKEQSKTMFKLRKEKVRELKQQIGIPLYSSCAFDK